MAPVMWDVEKLVAIHLAYICSLVIDVAVCGECMQDLVVTMLAFFLQVEHDTIMDAIKLASLCLLTFVNDGAAVTVNYTMMRQFPQQE